MPVRLAELSGRHVVVWGAGAEGTAAVALLTRWASPASVHVVVDGAPVPAGSRVHGVPLLRVDDASDVLAAVDVVVKSPGVSPYHGPLHQLLVARPEVRCTGGTQLWFAEAAAAGALARTIAVTGSKGKSTTSSLVAALLGGLGFDVLLAGNVGVAPLEVLAAGLDAGDAFPAGRWHVLELSSFQCSEVQHSPAVGVLTALFPEHLDWHGSVERYYGDKINLFAHGVGHTVANAANPNVASVIGTLPHPLAYGVRGAITVYDGAVVDADGTLLVPAGASPLAGEHNLVNLCGALSALAASGVVLAEHLPELLSALSIFRPLAHRLEPVGELRGRLVVDDGLSTAPEAAVAALATYADRPVGIIVGGHDRGLDYQALARAVAQRTSPLWVVGVPESGERIVGLIEEAVGAAPVTTSVVDDFDDAVAHLDAVVPAGGVILLSPAAPSFGRFRNYRERSEHFRALLGFEAT